MAPSTAGDGGRPRASLTVAGLGPGRPGAVTEETRELLGRPGPRFLRTRHHPTAEDVDGADSFDHLYRRAGSFEQVYGAIVDAVSTAAIEHGHAAYLVPGSPLVLERSVRALRAHPALDVTLLPAVSFLDEVWARLGVDPVDDGVRLVDGHRFAVEAADERGPLLVAHVHAQWVLSDIKLAIEPDEDQTVIVLQRLGTGDEHVVEVRWPDLDRRIEADHLTSLYIPRLQTPVGHDLMSSVELMARLRVECPWDRAQDHDTLRPYLMEEAYEVLDALNRVVEKAGDDQDRQTGGVGLTSAYEDLEGELGDLWFQILFHARLAAEQGQFTIADVARNLTEKMVNRHPHVFEPDSEPALSTEHRSPVDVDRMREHTWERQKRAETGRVSAFDGIPVALPALSLADKVLSRATRALGQPSPGPLAQELRSVLAPAGSHTDRAQREAVVGAAIVAIAWLARQLGVDAELAVRSRVEELADELRAAERRRVGATDPEAAWVIG